MYVTVLTVVLLCEEVELTITLVYFLVLLLDIFSNTLVHITVSSLTVHKLFHEKILILTTSLMFSSFTHTMLL